MRVLLVVLLLSPLPALGAEEAFQAPQTVEEARGIGEEVVRQLPEEVERSFFDQVLPVWRAMAQQGTALWNATLGGVLDGIADGIEEFITTEAEKQKEGIGQELEKEKEEFKKEGREAGKALLDRFLDLLRGS